MKRVVVAWFLGVVSLASFADEASHYSNPTVGLKLTKPEAWQFVSAQKNLESLKNVKLQDAEFQAAMLKYATAPLVVLMKFPEPYPDVNPSFKVTIKPLGQLKGMDAKEIAGHLLPLLQRTFKDVSVVQPPEDVTVSGLKGAYLRVTYTLEAVDAGPFPTSSELWIVPRGDYFFMIGAGTRTDEKTGTRDEIQAILNTIIIEP